MSDGAGIDDDDVLTSLQEGCSVTLLVEKEVWKPVKKVVPKVVYEYSCIDCMNLL